MLHGQKIPSDMSCGNGTKWMICWNTTINCLRCWLVNIGHPRRTDGIVSLITHELNGQKIPCNMWKWHQVRRKSYTVIHETEVFSLIPIKLRLPGESIALYALRLCCFNNQRAVEYNWSIESDLLLYPIRWCKQPVKSDRWHTLH